MLHVCFPISKSQCLDLFFEISCVDMVLEHLVGTLAPGAVSWYLPLGELWADVYGDYILKAFEGYS